MYCGQDCQRKAWREGHKDRCQQTRNEFRDVVLRPKPELLDRRFKMVFGESYVAPTATSKFTVKVSVMFHGQLLVRNEDGSVTGTAGYVGRFNAITCAFFIFVIPRAKRSKKTI